LTINCPRKIQNVFPQGVTNYDCIVAAGDLAPGNYSFVADVVVAGAPSGKMTGYVNIIGGNGYRATEAERVDQAAIKEGAEPEEVDEHAAEPVSEPASEPAAPPGESEKKSPAPGAVAASLILFLVLWRMKR